MADLSISGIRDRIFNPTKHEKSVSRSSNPFAQTSFKGNVLTADVFVPNQSSDKMDNKISFTGKLKASALVGSLSDMGSRFHRGIENITAFANRIKDNVVGFWNKMNSMEVSFEPAKEALVRTGARAKDALNSMLDTGIRHKDIAKLDLNSDDIYNSTHELFSSKVNAWTDSMATA